jgi:hypothetical protein
MELALDKLLTSSAVRTRCAVIGENAVRGKTRWFHLNESRIDECADLVAQVCKNNYPSLDIPYHSRWRHFDVAGVNLWQHYCKTKIDHLDSKDKTKTAIDLMFVSVLLDAGAGQNWRYRDPITDTQLSRSEGLAAASINLFFNRLFENCADNDFCLNASVLESLTQDSLAISFQHSNNNILIGVEGRMQLLKGLAKALRSDPKLTRPGDLYDILVAQSVNNTLTADKILREILIKFGSIWPGGLIHKQCNLGDAGRHSLIETSDASNGIVPFHKLSQWLSYSLVEPLQWGGIEVSDLDLLTGLPEYRNGGLFIDTGVLEPKDKTLLQERLQVGSEMIVEWRALTVYLLDRLAPDIRYKLNKNNRQLPLCSILQGGTWSAGREIAARLRPGAAPPIDLAIDGTVF